MNKTFIKFILLTVAIVIITITGATAAPIGIDNFWGFDYSGSDSSYYSSLILLYGGHQEDINLNDFGDYSNLCQTSTFYYGNYSDYGSMLLSDVNFNADMIGIEYSKRIRPQPAPVPEPSTIMLLGFGLVSAGAMLRKRMWKKSTDL